jgi:hypothetical protein
MAFYGIPTKLMISEFRESHKKMSFGKNFCLLLVGVINVPSREKRIFCQKVEIGTKEAGCGIDRFHPQNIYSLLAPTV